MMSPNAVILPHNCIASQHMVKVTLYDYLESHTVIGQQAHTWRDKHVRK